MRLASLAILAACAVSACGGQPAAPTANAGAPAAGEKMSAEDAAALKELEDMNRKMEAAITETKSLNEQTEQALKEARELTSAFGDAAKALDTDTPPAPTPAGN